MPTRLVILAHNMYIAKALTTNGEQLQIKFIKQ